MRQAENAQHTSNRITKTMFRCIATIHQHSARPNHLSVCPTDNTLFVPKSPPPWSIFPHSHTIIPSNRFVFPSLHTTAIHWTYLQRYTHSCIEFFLDQCIKHQPYSISFHPCPFQNYPFQFVKALNPKSLSPYQTNFITRAKLCSNAIIK